MVNIEDVSEEEKKQVEVWAKRFETLDELVKEFCEGEIRGIGTYIFIVLPEEVADPRDINNYIDVNLHENVFTVYSPNIFDTAMELAKEYEKRIGEEITVKRDYEEGHKAMCKFII